MKDTIKKALTIAVTFFLVLTMIPLSSVKAETDSVYEPITIGKSSLNGNAIWGATEEINDENVVLMDNSAFLYSKTRFEDGGLSNDGSLTMGSGVPYQLANGNASTAYDGTDCIRLTNDVRSVTMNLETLGAYDNVGVLATAGGPGAGNYADFSVTLTYTDGTEEQTKYKLYDWYDATSVTGVEKYNGIRRINKNSTTIDSGSSSSGAPYLHSSLIASDESKLIKSITFTMKGRNGSDDATGLYCCIFAITGQISSNAPRRPTAINATGVDTTKFTANWKRVDNADAYYLDVSKYPNFIDENGNPSFIDGYNNKEVSSTNCEVTGLEAKQKYYYRVRAKNEHGQSISSNVIKVVAMKHEHSWEYNGKGNIISAYCTNEENADACDYQNNNKLTLILNAENAIYTGEAYNKAEVANNITEETDEEASNITYEGIDGTSYTSTTTPPTNVGKYQASITLGGATAKKTFEITPASITDATLTNNEIEYTGNSLQPTKEALRVSSNSLTLSSNDYDISGDRYTNIGGPYIMKVEGKGNFTGEKNVEWYIVKRKLNVFVDMEDWTYGNPSNSPKISGNLPTNAKVEYKYYQREYYNYPECHYKELSEKPTNAGSYAVKAFIKADTYEDYKSDYIPFSVYPKLISIDWSNTTLTYNGNNQKPVATAKDLVGNDICDVTVTGEQKNAGEYTAIAESLSNANYVLPMNRSTGFVINKKKLTVKDLTVEDREYNETNNVTLKGGKLSGIIENDQVMAAMPSTGTVEDGNVGENKEVSYNIPELTGKDKDNYEYDKTAWPKLLVTIKKASENQSNTVITTTKEELDKVYDGKESVDVKSTSKNSNDPVIEYKKKGADDATYTTKKPTEAGDYTVRVTYPTDKNYNKSSTTKDFTIEKAKVTVKVNDLSKVYGDKDQELSYEVEGVVDGTPLKDITLSRKEGENVGTYVIKATQKEESNPNYAITFVDGTYTIASKDSKNAKVILKNVLRANGNGQTQEIDKVMVDGKELTKDDYDVVGNVAKESGVYTLTIKGKGNYSGECKVTYVVVPAKASQIKEDSKGNIVIGNGTLLLNIKTEKGTPATKLESNKAEIINMLIESKQLTANELSEIANGANVDVILIVKDANEIITESSKETILSNTKGYTIGQYIDISLYKYMIIDGNRDDGEAIHETSNKIKISIEIPTELINKDSKINRTYYIVRNHDGKVEILKGIYNEETNTYTFETDCFSDYAIIYKDEAVKTTVTGNVNPTSTETVGVKEENKVKVQKIKTGDDVFVVGYVVLLVLTLIGMVFLRKKENN